MKLTNSSVKIFFILNDTIIKEEKFDVIYELRLLAKKLQQDTYHIMQGMNGIHPGDPTHNTDLNPENYQKTM